MATRIPLSFLYLVLPPDASPQVFDWALFDKHSGAAPARSSRSCGPSHPAFWPAGPLRTSKVVAVWPQNLTGRACRLVCQPVPDGCPGRIRTSTDGSKGRCPTIRRPGSITGMLNSGGRHSAGKINVPPSHVNEYAVEQPPSDTYQQTGGYRSIPSYLSAG